MSDLESARDLLTFLRAAGFAVQTDGTQLFVRPREKLSPAEVDQVRALKPGLMAALAEERWTRCELCMGWADCASRDVGRLCVVARCPFRRKP